MTLSNDQRQNRTPPSRYAYLTRRAIRQSRAAKAAGNELLAAEFAALAATTLDSHIAAVRAARQ